MDSITTYDQRLAIDAPSWIDAQDVDGIHYPSVRTEELEELAANPRYYGLNSSEIHWIAIELDDRRAED